MRAAAIILTVLFLCPIVGTSAETGEESWRSNELDMSQWTDGPVLEGSPMDNPRPGNAVLLIEVEYQPGHFSSEVSGEIVIELFEEWAPNTTANMVMHVESGIYDGIFFHRVIDDFVTQSGDPTCKTTGIYPATSFQCGSGGDGHTLDMEHNENLSHVDGAIGMARSQDPDSADSQWYICETEAHNLDPENRDDEGYVTFGIVRNGMSHVRAIATVPTSDDPTGEEIVVNPASSAGRPVYEVRINNIDMIGVIPGSIGNQDSEEENVTMFEETATLSIKIVSILILITSLVTVAVVLYQKRTEIEEIEILEAELIDD
ncbi:MAG: peptidylprolyl isomerase [Candidatus Poseidoniaceae archaeon]|jgi:cyclophilin family peptidyl-prolyl cis-trans isomerase|nr:peptidylprolyl isomerase [Candidatus Poseidoniaceae archaeon]